ncbi:MAG: GC-type dockerin domain-anchored protein [Planctomycetota bacterium]
MPSIQNQRDACRLSSPLKAALISVALFASTASASVGTGGLQHTATQQSQQGHEPALVIRGASSTPIVFGAPGTTQSGYAGGTTHEPYQHRFLPFEDGTFVDLGFARPDLGWSASMPPIGPTNAFSLRTSADATSHRWGSAGWYADSQAVQGTVAFEVLRPVRIRFEFGGLTRVYGGYYNPAGPSYANATWYAQLVQVGSNTGEFACPSAYENVVYVTALNERRHRYTNLPRVTYLEPGQYILRARVDAQAGGLGNYLMGTAPEAMAWAELEARVLDECPADMDRDGDVDNEDLGFFLRAWSAQDSAADLSGSADPCNTRNGQPDGAVDEIDLTVFYRLWSAGPCD